MSKLFNQEMIALLPRLRRFTRALTGSADTADDLVQSACEKALARQHQFKQGTRLDSWVFQITRNHWIDQLRSKANQATVIDLDDWLDNEQAGVSGKQEIHMSLDKVESALQQLPEQHRSILVLVCIEGFSYQETADMLGLPLGTVMSRLARARVKLAGILNKSDTGDQKVEL